MRHPAAGAPRPARHDPQPAVGPRTCRPGPAPPGQHTRAPRTRQLARPPAVPRPRSTSASTVTTAPPSATRRPSRSGPAKETAGGPSPTPTRRSSRWRRRPTQVNATRPTPARSARSTAHERRYVVILGGGQHPGAAFLTRRCAAASRAASTAPVRRGSIGSGGWPTRAHVQLWRRRSSLARSRSSIRCAISLDWCWRHANARNAWSLISTRPACVGSALHQGHLLDLDDATRGVVSGASSSATCIPLDAALLHCSPR